MSPLCNFNNSIEGSQINLTTMNELLHHSQSAVFTESDSNDVMHVETNGDADSDEEDVSAPVKRRRKMVLIDEEEDED